MNLYFNYYLIIASGGNDSIEMSEKIDENLVHNTDVHMDVGEDDHGEKIIHFTYILFIIKS